MGWLNSLAGDIVALDAAPLIYFISARTQSFTGFGLVGVQVCVSENRIA